MLPKGSRAIALEENCLQAPKLTLSQTLNLTGRQLFSRTIVWLSPTLKLTLTLTQIPTLTEEQFSSGGNCPDTLQRGLDLFRNSVFKSVLKAENGLIKDKQVNEIGMIYKKFVLELRCYSTALLFWR